MTTKRTKEDLRFPLVVRWFGASRYKLIEQNGKVDFLHAWDEAVVTKAYCTVEQLANYINDGKVEILEEAPAESLQLPFIGDNGMSVYGVTRGADGYVTLVRISSDEGWEVGKVYVDYYTDESMIEKIKDKSWKVLAAPFAPEPIAVEVDTTPIKAATEAANELASALKRVKDMLQ